MDSGAMLVMSRPLIVIFLSLILICTTQQVRAGEDIVGPGVWEVLETQDTMRVMIVFDMPMGPLDTSPMTVAELLQKSAHWPS